MAEFESSHVDSYGDPANLNAACALDVDGLSNALFTFEARGDARPPTLVAGDGFAVGVDVADFAEV
jgi:hypothetical protein